ncbi:hypothetical protein [Burkholderia sp. BDU5]|uniref:hypothetical protein n=1 Tax=Burkholderia sp. BDU5 TaxID=1385590 RepID=UPI00075CBDA5|nr:hypothetical protein [Burkholderia sp. BDU5]KVE36220.1 hypothetical protein WS69_13440 [Burkholderia sp. BDU5]
MDVSLTIDGLRDARIFAENDQGEEFDSEIADSGDIGITCREGNGFSLLTIYFNGLTYQGGQRLADLFLNRREMLALARALQSAAEVVSDIDPRMEGSHGA